MQRHPLPRLPNGEIDWKTVQREREERANRVWASLFEARIQPRGRAAFWLRIPKIVKRE